MSNQWLRLWHDMPTDPKWRTIARASGQPISLVQATYLHLLVDASRNVTRGHVTVTQEDMASALDVTEDAIKSIFDAMQGRVVDNGRLTGWAARQPKREDAGDDSTGAKSAAERKREQRERDRLAAEKEGSHDASRNVTLDKDKEEDKDKKETPKAPRGAEPVGFAEFWIEYPNHKAKSNAVKAFAKVNADLHPVLMAALRVQAKSKDWLKDAGQFVPHAATWLNGCRWEDTPAQTAANAPAWLIGTKFSDVFEANNAGCYAHNATKFPKEAHA